MKRSLVAVLAFVVVLAILASVTLFRVREDQQALVLQFGDPLRVISPEEAGLHPKLPWQNVVRFDAKNLMYDANPVEVIVANEERLLVDAFVRYRIADQLVYYQRLSRGSAAAEAMRDRFNARLSAVLNEAVRQVLGEVEIKDIITERRGELMAAIQTSVAEEVRKLGVDVIDVRIRQADFPPENAQRVYDRMSSDYNKQAQAIRADGERRAREIRAEANKQAVQILAEAREEAQRMRGRADAERNAIFAEAYSADPEFFAFYRSLNAYERALDDGQSTIVLSPDSEFFRYFDTKTGIQ